MRVSFLRLRFFFADFHAVSKTTHIRHIVRCSILKVGKKGEEIGVTNLNPSSKIGVIAFQYIVCLKNKSFSSPSFSSPAFSGDPSLT